MCESPPNHYPIHGPPHPPSIDPQKAPHRRSIGSTSHSFRARPRSLVYPRVSVWRPTTQASTSETRVWSLVVVLEKISVAQWRLSLGRSKMSTTSIPGSSPVKLTRLWTRVLHISVCVGKIFAEWLRCDAVTDEVNVVIAWILLCWWRLHGCSFERIHVSYQSPLLPPRWLGRRWKSTWLTCSNFFPVLGQSKADRLAAALSLLNTCHRI